MEYSEAQARSKQQKLEVWRTRRKIFKVNLVLIQLMNRRVELGLSQEELAAKVGIGVNTIAYSETGKGSTNFLNMVKWANALGFTLELRDHTP